MYDRKHNGLVNPILILNLCDKVIDIRRKGERRTCWGKHTL